MQITFVIKLSFEIRKRLIFKKVTKVYKKKVEILKFQNFEIICGNILNKSA